MTHNQGSSMMGKGSNQNQGKFRKFIEFGAILFTKCFDNYFCRRENWCYNLKQQQG